MPVTSADARFTGLDDNTPLISEWIRPVPKPNKSILPVVSEPSVSVCLFAVPIVPVPVRNRALPPAFAEIDAVGVPPATLLKANFALDVAAAPRSKSSVVFLSKIEPLPTLKGEPPLTTGRMPVISAVKSTALNEGLAPPCNT